LQRVKNPWPERNLRHTKHPRFTKEQLKSAQAYDLNEAKTGTSTAPATAPAYRTR
jgi:hypothetical protein